MKRVVLLDIDGVAANFIEGCLPIIKEITGRDHAHDDVNQWLVEKALGLTDDETKTLYDRIVQPGWVRALPVYEGAKEGVARLREFAEVHPVTAHFYTCPHWVHEREAWILEHFGIPATDIVHTHAKHLVAGDVLVEDKTATLVKWMQRQHHGNAVRMRRKYNEGEDWKRPGAEFGGDWGVTVNDWPHLVRFLELRFGVDGGSTR